MADNNPSSNQQGQGDQHKPSLSWSQPTTQQTPAVKPVVSTPVTPVASVTPATSNTGTYVGIFVAGIIIGALIGWGITSSHTGGDTSITASSTDMMASSTDSTVESGSTMQMSTTTSGAITLSSPEKAGFAVEVSKVSVTQPTWLVVYEDTNGMPGNAIGAGLFFADSTSGTIQLIRATLPGSSYLVGQSLDNGDKIFSLTNDKPVTDEKGNLLFTAFTAQ